MLPIVFIKGAKYVSLIEFYDYIFGDNKKNYARWVRHYVIDQDAKMPVKGLDYIDLDDVPTLNRVHIKGQQRKDYLISLDFMKQLCFDIKTHRCKDLRDWANGLNSRV